MYSPIAIGLKYIKYWLRSSNGRGHGIHSPFVYDFVINVLNDNRHYPAYDTVEQLRRNLLADSTPVPLEDYGAGGTIIGSRSVAAIAARAAKSPKYAKLLYRMAKYYAPHYILELGTSLGISTSYIAAANPENMVITGEGNFVVASIARNNFVQNGLNNISVVTGNFDNTLPEMAASLPHIDFAFIDGNHRFEPTLRYFRELLPRMAGSSMIIFDDIHWSREMEDAWAEIRNDPKTMLTVDLFFFGIVFFRPEFKVKQHFAIRF